MVCEPDRQSFFYLPMLFSLHIMHSTEVTISRPANQSHKALKPRWSCNGAAVGSGDIAGLPKRPDSVVAGNQNHRVPGANCRSCFSKPSVTLFKVHQRASVQSAGTPRMDHKDGAGHPASPVSLGDKSELVPQLDGRGKASIAIPQLRDRRMVRSRMRLARPLSPPPCRHKHFR